MIPGQIAKTIIFSALTSLSVIIWHEVLGMKFLIGLGFIITLIVLFLWKR